MAARGPGQAPAVRAAVTQGDLPQKKLLGGGEDSEPFRVVRGGWASATEFVCTSSARRQLRTDAATRDNQDEDDEGKVGGFMSALFAMMYTPYGFRVVCECP